MDGYCLKVTALTLAVLLGSDRAVTADVIRQTPGTDFSVFEAEDFDSLVPEGATEGFVLVTTDDPLFVGVGDSLALPPDTNASGEAALFTAPDPSWLFTTATWQLEFATAGIYSLYVRYSLYDVKRDPNYDNEDSLFLPLEFNQPPTEDGRYDLSNQQHNDSLEDPPYWEGNFHWQKAPIDYEVGPENTGQVLGFSLANREPGNAVDLMVFSLDPTLDPQGDEFLEQDLDEMFLAPPPVTGLQAGDADQDLDFDQLDLVQVQIAAKYLTGQPATWGEGDWDGAPGGQPGNPPLGNGRFDQLDIISALAPGHYLTGPYAASAGNGMTGAAVPEPATIVLFSFGLVTCLGCLRKRT